MINVDILTGDIRQVQGVSRYIRQMAAQQDLFEANNISLNKIYSCDAIYECDQLERRLHSNKVEYSAPIAKRGVKQALKESAAFHAACVLREYNQISKQSAYRLLKDNSTADVILCEDLFATYEYIRKARSRRRIVFTSHAEGDLLGQMLMQRPPLQKTRFEKRLRDIVNTVVSESDVVVAICQSSYDYLRSEFDLESTLINNAVADPTVVYRPKKQLSKDDVINCAIVGSITVRKGQDLLIEALKGYVESCDCKLRLHFFGDGPERDKLETRVETYGLQRVVTFYGNVDDIEERLSSMDALLVPTRMDTIPLAIIEGMRSRLPVFATEVGGIPELVAKGRNGFLYEPTLSSIRKMLQDVEGERGNLRTLGLESYEMYLEKYSMEAFVDSYCRVFKGLV